MHQQDARKVHCLENLHRIQASTCTVILGFTCLLCYNTTFSLSQGDLTAYWQTESLDTAKEFKESSEYLNQARVFSKSKEPHCPWDLLPITASSPAFRLRDCHSTKQSYAICEGSMRAWLHMPLDFFPAIVFFLSPKRRCWPQYIIIHQNIHIAKFVQCLQLDMLYRACQAGNRFHHNVKSLN